MFTSKIRAAAAASDVPVSFARTREAALAAVRELNPPLIILDLNNPRTDPLGLAATWKADPETREITLAGYVAHVQTDLINAARSAGVDEVFARSAFVQKLPDLLARGR
ncbi:MAG: response regulator [Vicinamibacterales bacterium]